MKEAIARRNGVCLAALALVVAARPAGANEALDLLEANPGSGVGTVRVTGPDPAASREETLDPGTVDPSLPRRWNTELQPSFKIRLTEAEPVVSEVAARGLFEWRMEGGELSLEDGGDTKIDSSRLRRARLGLALLAYYDTEIQIEGLFDGGGSYRGLETLKARIPVGGDRALTLGKFPPPFTLEYAQDPAVRWFHEMSPLVTQIVPASSLGALLEGHEGNWDWKGGWFSGNADRDLPSFDGNGYVLAGVGYSINGPAGGDAGGTGYQRWHFDYIHNFDKMRSESVPLGYEHLVATGFQLSSGRLDFMGDFLLAKGDAGSVWGMSLAGGYWLMDDALRLVARYDYASSDDLGGVLAGWGVPRSGSDAVQPFAYPELRAGGELQSIYSGLNLHLFDHNLILSSGLEFRTLSDVIDADGDTIDSWIWQAGGRLAF